MSTPNERAFLKLIPWSEGCSDYGIGEDGIDNSYRILYGSTHKNPSFFSSFKDHPRQYIHAGGITSSAAGAYQILADIYDAYKIRLSLKDFSPESQDLIALRLITECHALNDINVGNLATAINKCSSRWASFPGNNYGQHTNKMEALQLAFIEAGGTLSGC